MSFSVFLDKAALFIALAIELTVMSITMVIISPGVIESVAMVFVGFIVVCFSIRSWLKGGAWYNKFLWAVFAFISFLFNWNFALVSTQTQTLQNKNLIPIEQVLSEDSILKIYNQNLTSSREDFNSYIEGRNSLQEQFANSSRGTTIDSVLRRQEATEQSIESLQKSIRDYEVKIAGRTEEVIKDYNSNNSSIKQRVKITAEGLFYAIPNAIKEQRWMELGIFFLVFLGLEITIIVSATGEKNPQRSRSKRKVVVVKKQPINEEVFAPIIPVIAEKVAEENKEQFLDFSKDVIIKDKIVAPEIIESFNIIKEEKTDEEKLEEIMASFPAPDKGIYGTEGYYPEKKSKSNRRIVKKTAAPIENKEVVEKKIEEKPVVKKQRKPITKVEKINPLEVKEPKKHFDTIIPADIELAQMLLKK